MKTRSPPAAHLLDSVWFGSVETSVRAFGFPSCGVTNADRITSIIYDANAKLSANKLNIHDTERTIRVWYIHEIIISVQRLHEWDTLKQLIFPILLRLRHHFIHRMPPSLSPSLTLCEWVEPIGPLATIIYQNNKMMSQNFCLITKRLRWMMYQLNNHVRVWQLEMCIQMRYRCVYACCTTR